MNVISPTTKLEMRKALQLIQKTEWIFLTTHESTDGDDLGSLLATRQFLLSLGKQVTSAVSKGVPESLRFLPGAEEVADVLENREFDLVMTFGCNSIARTGFDLLNSFTGSVINIDHHPDNKLFGQINIVESTTSSVAELMYYFFEVNKFNINKEAAVCLLTGIFTDTGGFKHSSTTSATLSVASELMKKGARIDQIANTIMRNNNPANHRIWTRALENARLNKKIGMMYSVITQQDMQETQATDDDLGGLVNFLCMIPQARFSLLLRQDGDVVRGSLRSEPEKNVNVNKIATSFGGGGHKFASGFKIRGQLVRQGNSWQIIQE